MPEIFSTNAPVYAAPLAPQNTELNNAGTASSPMSHDLCSVCHGANQSMTILPGDRDIVVVMPKNRLGSGELSFKIVTSRERGAAGNVGEDAKKANEGDKVRDTNDSNEAIELAKEDVKNAIRERYNKKDTKSDPASVRGLSDDGKRQVFENVVNWTFEGFDADTNAWAAALAEYAADSGLREYLSHTVSQATYNKLSDTKQFALAKAVIDAAGMVVK